MGNTVVWKPASTAVYSGYYLMQLFKEAGFPDGVINFVPCSGALMGSIALKDPHLAGIHFTGSTTVFQQMWRLVGEQIQGYRSYPRIVGETGGKDFVVAHASAGVEALCTGLVRGAFEYQGQKCSAASRAYIPKSLWPKLRRRLQAVLEEMTIGDPRSMEHLINALIDQDAFDRVMGYIEKARRSDQAEILFGGHGDATKGYFVEPTVIEVNDPAFITMTEEIFGPVLSIYVYADEAYVEILELCDRTSPYALTGAVFATDRNAIALAENQLRHAAGNFYINDKPTGAVVGQQPFGGSRAFGTNDKAGSMLNLLRWTSARTIKENLDPPTNYRYPFMD
jgi:1-pyrroline-5-carboxylate dehydrogenase